MDQFNVLTPTSDLDELERDMEKWTCLPFQLRMRSDEECIRRYNMRNIDLFNKIKASIISDIVPKDSTMISAAISEGNLEVSDYIFNTEEEDFLWKLQMSDQLQLSPNVVIINPFKNNNQKDYDLEQLNDKYSKFCFLTLRNKRFSNAYSINLWGYDIPNMFDIMKKHILSLDGLETTDIELRRSVTEQSLDPLINKMNRLICEDDKLGLMNLKLDSCADMNIYEKSIYNKMNESINNALYERDFYDVLPKVVPYFTIDEMNELGYSDNEASKINPKDYYRTIMEKMNLLAKETDSELKEKLTEEVISLGWNPSVEITENNLEFARRRQSKWLNEHACRVIDIRNLKSKSALLESTSYMRSIYKKENLYPVYIILSFSGTIFGHIIRTVKHSTYTHAGLSLDSNLNGILTYKFDTKFNGFHTESLSTYLGKSKDAMIDVLCIFVDKNTKMKLESVIKNFDNMKDKTSYGFGNLFNIIINRSKDYDPDNLSLVCSQFVDTVLKLSNIDLTKKPSNLVIPQDFSELSSNPKIYRVYQGYVREYNEKKVEDAIYNLFQLSSNEEIKYNEVIESALNYYIEAFGAVTENQKANEVLEEIRTLLKPEAAIHEFKFPIKINKKGDVVIELYKSLEDEYQEAHRLLKQYENINLEGIKHELARLFYVNTAIEKKIKKMDKADDNYKKFIDLRARVLNDFKKYFKIVLAEEPDFNFTEYFKKSEYYNGNIIIDNAILKFTGNLIKKFLQALGI